MPRARMARRTPIHTSTNGKSRLKSPPKPRNTCSTPTNSGTPPEAINTNTQNSARAKHTPDAIAVHSPFDFFSTAAALVFAIISLHSLAAIPSDSAKGRQCASYIIPFAAIHFNRIRAAQKSVGFSSHSQHIFHRLSTVRQQENFRRDLKSSLESDTINKRIYRHNFHICV